MESHNTTSAVGTIFVLLSWQTQQHEEEALFSSNIPKQNIFNLYARV